MLDCKCCNSEIIDLGCISKCDSISVRCVDLIITRIYTIKYLDAGICKEFDVLCTVDGELSILNYFKENRQIDFQIFNLNNEQVCDCFTFKNVLCIK